MPAQNPLGRNVDYGSFMAAMAQVGGHADDPNNVFDPETGTYGPSQSSVSYQRAAAAPVIMTPSKAQAWQAAGMAIPANATWTDENGKPMAAPGGSSARPMAQASSPVPTPQIAQAPGVSSSTSMATLAANPSANTAAGVSPTSSAPAATLFATPQAQSQTNSIMPTSSGPLTASGTGDINGSSSNYWTPQYGGVPVVPDPISSASQAITGNISNLGDIYNLAGSVNAFGAQQARGQYEANLPGYDQMTGQASQDILANLQGQVPPDVINQLQQAGAERGIATGAPGSANAGAQYLKALGLTSLGQQTLGQSQLTQAIQRTPTSPLFNVASTLVSPTDEQAARTAANIYAAAPNPQAAAQAAMDNALKGIQAGAGAGGGGGGTALPGGGGGGTVHTSPASPTYPTVAYGSPGSSTGTSAGADPYAAWQTWYNSLPGMSNSGTAAADTGTNAGVSATDETQNWWENMFGPGSYSSDLGTSPVPSYDPFQTDTSGGYADFNTDPNYDPFYDPSLGF